MTNLNQSPEARSGNDATGTERTPIEAVGQVRRVTLFEDRAEVVRLARVRLPAGVSWVRVGGVSTVVSDPSVMAQMGGGGRVLSSHVTRRVRQVPMAGDTEIHALEAEGRVAQARRSAAERALEALSTQETRVAGLLEHWATALRRVPRSADADLAGWRTSYQRLITAQQQALDDAAAARSELRDAQRDEQRVALRLEQGRRTEPRLEATIEVQVECAHACEATLEITYRTACALWRPEHLCRLQPGEGGGYTMQITTWATAWQRTGEDWRDVPLRFSTARPAQAAAPPVLSEDNLRLRRKTEQERKQVVVEAREQTIQVAGLGRGQTAVEEMPGVDDGGEPLMFAALRPTTLPSTGQPVRVEIGTTQLSCKVERVAFPERSIGAHLRATATLASNKPLLAGPVHIVRGGELAGRGRMPFVAPGEPFELGFGIDDGVRVRRKVEETRETTAVMGTQKITRTVRLYLSNLSGERKQLLLTERVPVSEIRDVEISVTPAPALRVDGKDGFVRFDADLEPGATRELFFTYRIEAAARVTLPAL